jgi:hypothetical protein
MPNCDYRDCSKEATTTGQIYTKYKQFVSVNACETHKNLPSFFEDVAIGEEHGAD